mgnify:CR=1 FL=1
MSLIVCSALKKRYRDRLREGSDNLRFLWLTGDYECILQRMQQRNPVKIRARSGLQPFEVLVMTEQRWQEEMN